MKKKRFSRFFRYSLKAFLVLVFGTAILSAWLAKTNIEYEHEQASVAELSEATAKSRGIFQLKREEDFSTGAFAVY